MTPGSHNAIRARPGPGGTEVYQNSDSLAHRRSGDPAGPGHGPGRPRTAIGGSPAARRGSAETDQSWFELIAARFSPAAEARLLFHSVAAEVFARVASPSAWTAAE
jgi:hypothetical protein